MPTEKLNYLNLKNRQFKNYADILPNQSIPHLTSKNATHASKRRRMTQKS